MMFKSLKSRLLGYFFIANSLILLSFGYFIYSTAQEGLSRNLDSFLRLVSLDFLSDVKGGDYINAQEAAEDLEHEFNISPLFIRVIHYNKQDQKIAKSSSSSQKGKELFEIPLNEAGKLYTIDYYDKGDYRVSSMLVLEDEEQKMFFQLAIQKEKHSPLLKELMLILLIANPIILLIYLLITNILMKRMLSPVHDVVSMVNRISAEKLFKRLNTEHIPLEIEELVATFNALLQRLEESFKRISTFSSDASHELKTPLTVIKGEIDVALRHERTPQEYKKVLEAVGAEVDRVQETIEQLLFLAQKDSAEMSGNFQNIYFDELLLEAITQLKPYAKSREIEIKITQIIPFTVKANEALLNIVCTNLIKNAILYSPKNSQVEVNLYEDKTDYILQIEDAGQGIAKEELPFVYERFYRAEKARARQNGGTGLGLSIVKMILDLHHYAISMRSTLGKGTLVEVRIPKKYEGVS
jgi:heavy metal sensor kinase